MKFWDKIIQIGKIAAAVGTIGGAVLFFDSARDNINDKLEDMMDTLTGFRKTYIEYQLKNDEIIEINARQFDDVFKQLRNLNTNQKAIIFKSDESQKILEEIKNQQLLNGTVDIGYLESKDAYVIQFKKKELEL
jgi:hypothetical protein